MTRRLILIALLCSAESTARPVAVPRPEPACRATIAATAPAVGASDLAPAPPAAVAWETAPPPWSDSLNAWCEAVGPAVVVAGAPDDGTPSDALTVASWNMHVGAGDLSALLSALGTHPLADSPRPPFVLLLQEALRRGPVVPPLSPGARAARRIAHESPDARLDIVEAARALGLWAVYVPSMRNGAGAAEDRGNAIVSNRPLEAVSAIELPGGRQRRVAVAADVTGRSPGGRRWRVRVASVHLESQSGPRRLWVFAGAVRAAQMRAVVEALQDEEVAVLGGDFNSWAGFGETAYREAADAFPDTVVTDPRPTFGWRRRLDHLLFRLPDGWRARFARLDERYGSDHHPLAGVVSIPDAGVGPAGVGPHPGRFCDPCAPERDTPGTTSSGRVGSGAGRVWGPGIPSRIRH